MIQPEQSPSIAKLMPALIAARAEYPALVKDSVNPHHGNQYSSLASVLQACDGPLGKHDLAVLQVPVWSEGALTLFTTLCHTSGEWIRAVYPVLVSEDPQVMGAGLTYARRYSYMTVAGIAPADDDGNAAAAHAREAARKRYEQKAAQTNGHANGRSNGHTNRLKDHAPSPAPKSPEPAPKPAAPIAPGAALLQVIEFEVKTGSALRSWARRIEAANGPGIAQHIAARAAKLGWPENSTRWSQDQVEAAFRDAEDSLELVYDRYHDEATVDADFPADCGSRFD